MGFKASDITVISSTGPTTNIPSRKEIGVKAFSVARTNTVSVLKVVLPADASIVSVLRERGIASDAGTTATVTFTIANNSGTISTVADDVKTNGATTGFVNLPSLPNLEPLPLTGDITINVVYAETGTPSTTGGPWTYIVNYVR